MKTCINKVLLLIFVSVISTSYGQFNIYKSKKTPSGLNLKGNVQFVEIVHSTIRQDDPWDKKSPYTDTNAWMGSSYLFNEQGSCLDYKSYLINKEEGKVISAHTLSTFNKYQHRTERKEYGKNDLLVFVEKITYVYDDQNRIQETLITYDYETGEASRKVRKNYTYNIDKTVRVETLDLLDEKADTMVEEYTEKGNFTDYKTVMHGVFDDFGRAVYQSKDENGFVLTEVYKKDDAIEKSYYLTYDDRNNVIEKKEVNANPEFSCVYKYVYDANDNNILETTYDYKNKFQAQYKSTFDEHNNETRTTHMKNMKSIDFEMMYAYTYDSHENWTVKHETSTSKYNGPSVTQRTIKYFE